MNIAITSVTREESAYDKWIYFTYEGEEYHVKLHWDKYEGFFLDFTNYTEPEWVSKWDDNHEKPIAYVLDELTDKVLEGEGE